MLLYWPLAGDKIDFSLSSPVVPAKGPSGLKDGVQISDPTLLFPIPRVCLISTLIERAQSNRLFAECCFYRGAILICKNQYISVSVVYWHFCEVCFDCAGPIRLASCGGWCGCTGGIMSMSRKKKGFWASKMLRCVLYEPAQSKRIFLCCWFRVICLLYWFLHIKMHSGGHQGGVLFWGFSGLRCVLLRFCRRYVRGLSDFFV